MPRGPTSRLPPTAPRAKRGPRGPAAPAVARKLRSTPDLVQAAFPRWASTDRRATTARQQSRRCVKPDLTTTRHPRARRRRLNKRAERQHRTAAAGGRIPANRLEKLKIVVAEDLPSLYYGGRAAARNPI